MSAILKYLNIHITPYRLTWLGTLTAIFGLYILEYTSSIASIGVSLLLLAMYIDKYGW